MKFLAPILGLQGARANTFCIWCECLKSQIRDFSGKNQILLSNRNITIALASFYQTLIRINDKSFLCVGEGGGGGGGGGRWDEKSQDL